MRIAGERLGRRPRRLPVGVGSSRSAGSACFWLQPSSMKSTASQSSRSRYSGTGDRVPKSSGVSTRPWPKSVCQSRLTATRAVSGERGSTSHFANASRFGGASAGKADAGRRARAARSRASAGSTRRGRAGAWGDAARADRSPQVEHGGRGLRASSPTRPAISSLMGCRSGTRLPPGGEHRAASSAAVRRPAGLRIARIAAWSIGGAAGAGAVVRLTRQQPSIRCVSPPAIRTSGAILQFRARRQVERLLELHDRDRRLVPEQMAAVGLARPTGRRRRSGWRPARRDLGWRARLAVRRIGAGRGRSARLREVGRGIHELQRLPRLAPGFFTDTLHLARRPSAVAAGAVHEEVAVGEGLELQARGPREVGLRLEDHAPCRGGRA